MAIDQNSITKSLKISSMLRNSIGFFWGMNSNILKRITKKSRLNTKGMTLVEILIVMVILGGILSILGQTVFTNFKKARVRQARIQMEELAKAIEIFHSDCGFFPQAGGLKALIEAPADCKNWGPEAYVKPNLLKDPWGTEFVYEPTGSSYVIKSLGGDRKEGGTGADADISNADQ